MDGKQVLGVFMGGCSFFLTSKRQWNRGSGTAGMLGKKLDFAAPGSGEPI